MIGDIKVREQYTPENHNNNVSQGFKVKLSVLYQAETNKIYPPGSKMLLKPLKTY